MKALILAAGTARRLGNIVKDTPKCLLEINGVTMLDFWIEKLMVAGVTDILITAHHHANKIMEHIRRYKEKNLDRNYNQKRIEINIFYEKKLIGSAEALYQNKDYFEEGSFLLIYSDVWTPFFLNKIANHYFNGFGESIIGIYKSEKIYDCGMVKLDGGMIIGFEEKPTQSVDAFSGIAVINPCILELLKPEMYDIARDWLPAVAKRVSGIAPYFIKEKIIDIGTPEGLKQAREEA